jgi:hypothetical protein
MRREEFGELVSIVFRPFVQLSPDAHELANDATVLAALNTKKLLGFLNTLKDLVDQVGNLLVDHLPLICATLLSLVAHVFASDAAPDASCLLPDEGGGRERDREAEADEGAEAAGGGGRVGEGEGEGDGDGDGEEESEEFREKVYKRLRGLCLRRVRDVVKKFVSSDFSKFLPRLLNTLHPRILRLPIENTQSPVGLLETFHEMAHNDKLASYLFTSSDMLPAVFGCMSAPSAAFAVRKNTLEIADTLVARAHELGLEADMSTHMSVLLQHVYLHLKLLVDKGGPRAAASGLATPQERMQVWSYCMCPDSYYVSVGCCRQLGYMCAHLLATIYVCAPAMYVC